MVESVSGLRQHISLATEQLLLPGEKIYIVDDDPAIREPLRIFLEDQGLAVVEAGSGEEFLELLKRGDTALALLDIGLPDLDGRSVLAKTVVANPDAAVVMLTGVADLKVAMDCIREGADDYLSKPVQFSEILFVVKKALEKRRLIFENRKYHEDLEKAHFRIHVLHQLSVKMNTAYLSAVELDEILQAVLVGITAEEGLRFNRAFLAMFDDANEFLQGKMAIGPDCRDDAGRIWSEIEQKSLSFLDIVHSFRSSCRGADREVNRIILALKVPVADRDNILIKSARERRSIRVSRQNASLPVAAERRHRDAGELSVSSWPPAIERRNDDDSPMPVPGDLIELLQEDSFVVVPLFSPSRSFGVIIADNFVTNQEITDNHINSLELFASQASLAIEHSHLYQDQQRKIAELEALTEELNRSKDLLVAAERYSALGHMAAQLVHSIRNPVTSIGGIARILNRKVESEEQKRFLEVVSKETARLEKIMDDLYSYTDQFKELHLEEVELCDILQRTQLLIQTEMIKQGIAWKLTGCDRVVWLNADRQHLRQMFLHLFRNAIEAMPDGGELEVALSSDEQWLHVAVRDTGIGMPENNLSKATDPFFTTKTYGTGMGLTMVENVLKTHGGNFVINRRPERGLEVLVRLPVSLRIAEPPPPA
jgi:signal transduction histidine kinase/DNA-binding response OmpR family regulator